MAATDKLTLTRHPLYALNLPAPPHKNTNNNFVGWSSPDKCCARLLRAPRMGHSVDQFCDEVDPDLICQICSEVLDESRSGCNEGHLYCEGCLTTWIRQTPTCPSCRQNIDADSLVRNRLVDKLVAALQVKCANHMAGGRSKKQRTGDDSEGDGENTDPQTGRSTAAASQVSGGDGCDWAGALSALESHRDVCAWERIACQSPGCAMRLPRGEMPAHAEGCPRRRVTCEVCAEEMDAQSLATVHPSACPRRLMPCPNECGASLPVCEHAAHAEADCPLSRVACPFAAQGCAARPQRRDASRHLTEAAGEHAALASARVHALEASVQQALDAVKELAAANVQLAAKVGAVTATNTQLSARVGAADGAMKQLTAANTHLSAKVGAADGAVKELTAANARLGAKVDAAERRAKDEKHRHRATLTFEVKEFAAKRDAGEIVRSLSVYLGGYEMGISVFTAGQNPKKKNYPGIFIEHRKGGCCVMPVRLAGSSVQLVSQKSGGIDWISQYDDDDVIAGAGIGQGDTEIMSPSELKSDGYLKNDKIIIRAEICVDTSQPFTVTMVDDDDDDDDDEEG